MHSCASPSGKDTIATEYRQIEHNDLSHSFGLFPAFAVACCCPSTPSSFALCQSKPWVQNSFLCIESLGGGRSQRGPDSKASLWPGLRSAIKTDSFIASRIVLRTWWDWYCRAASQKLPCTICTQNARRFLSLNNRSWKTPLRPRTCRCCVVHLRYPAQCEYVYNRHASRPVSFMTPWKTSLWCVSLPCRYCSFAMLDAEDLTASGNSQQPPWSTVTALVRTLVPFHPTKQLSAVADERLRRRSHHAASYEPDCSRMVLPPAEHYMTISNLQDRAERAALHLGGDFGNQTSCKSVNEDGNTLAVGDVVGSRGEHRDIIPEHGSLTPGDASGKHTVI